MDPDKIIKAVPALAAAIPFTAIVKRMLGPAADELAEMWRDQVRLYRYERQLKCVEKAERMAQEAGFTPKAVPPKILFPLLEGASFEDNEELHTMWAALLANAASPEKAGGVRPGFIAALRQMAPDEASLLNWLYDRLAETDFRASANPHSLSEAVELLRLDETKSDGRIVSIPDQLGVCLDGLEAAQLISRRDYVPVVAFVFYSRMNSPSTPNPCYVLTNRGVAFVEACRPPKGKS